MYSDIIHPIKNFGLRSPHRNGACICTVLQGDLSLNKKAFCPLLLIFFQLSPVANESCRKPQSKCVLHWRRCLNLSTQDYLARLTDSIVVILTLQFSFPKLLYFQFSFYLSLTQVQFPLTVSLEKDRAETQRGEHGTKKNYRWHLCWSQLFLLLSAARLHKDIVVQ